MIPTALLAGLVVGRWWAVPVVGAVWAIVVVVFGDCGASCIPGALLLGAANCVAGVAAHRVLIVALKTIRQHVR